MITYENICISDVTQLFPPMLPKDSKDLQKGRCPIQFHIETFIRNGISFGWLRENLIFLQELHLIHPGDWLQMQFQG